MAVLEVGGKEYDCEGYRHTGSYAVYVAVFG